ncbi:MAG: hypothetical protein UFE80_05060, partial [Christensenellales bacterium]|nr:hypothetical protein [Christensenellales bacterium]
MSKLKVQEATKELSLGASKLLEDVLRIRRSASDTLASLKKIEQTFVQQEEERREAERLEQQRLAQEKQSTAWIMPEEEPQAEPLTETEPEAQPAPVQETSA